MAPGPDFAIVVRQSVASGARSGMAAALGVGAGVFVWAVSAAIGVAALLAASAVAFTIVKVVGAAYLLYLGLRALRSASREPHASEPTAGVARPESIWTSFRQGLITNVLNPKAAAFFVALMPQFVGSDSAYGATLLLAGTAGAIAVGWFCVLANLVGARCVGSSRGRQSGASSTLSPALPWSASASGSRPPVDPRPRIES
jgi:threonine/homoserine/homoserine lactone efflux protein